MAFRSNGPIMVALPPFRGVIRRILLGAVAMFFLLLVAGLFSPALQVTVEGLLTLIPLNAFHFFFWQFATYPFISSGILSFLFAALSVWFFGASLEEERGSRWMGEFFLACTVGGGLLAAFITFTAGRLVPGLGPANQAFGLWPFSIALLLAFARMHPDQELNFNFILRVKAKYIAILYLLIYLAILLSSGQRFDALVVITNCLAGYLYLQLAPRRGLGLATTESLYTARNAWSRARRRRAAKKFTVYMQKQGRDVRFDESGRYVDPEAERPNSRDPNDRKWMN